MNIKSLTDEIAECINCYERRRFGEVEADCLNLARKYDSNDNTAQGFLVAVRKQEHWKGESFEEIAKELRMINDGKISRYIIIRSLDCDLEMLKKVFIPKMYTNRELQQIARVANSSNLLEMIYDYVYSNIGMVEGYPIMGSIATNKVTSKELFDKLYVFDKRLSSQIFLNSGCQASTELLMKMFYECDDLLKELHIFHLVCFNRTDINNHLTTYLLQQLTNTLKNIRRE